MSLVKVNKLSREFGQVRALDSVDFEFEKGGHYVIRGASGSGKSTLLYLLGGLDRPSTGTIFVDGKDLSKLNDEELAAYRNRFVGFVFQFHFLLPTMSCMDNILLPSRIGGNYSQALKDQMITLSKHLDVSHCLSKFPFELSGGEQQRINIIRALSLKPKLLLCDEPTGNLDSHNGERVTTLIKSVAREFGATLIVVTHDEKVASHFDRHVMMQDGKIL